MRFETAELNLTTGFSGTLLDQVLEFRNREDAKNDVDMDAQACQQKETTHAHDIDAHRKRLSAELLVTSRNHAFGPVLLARELGRKRKADKRQSEK